MDRPGLWRRSTVPSTDGDPRFTGREAELGAIEGALRSSRIAVIHGPPGLGKSRLAMEYAHHHADAYPGGTFFVRFDQPPPTDLAKLLRDLFRQGQFAEALPWFERAVAAKEQGDVHGRVNSESLGISLHAVGDCHARQGQFAQALAWFERAVAAKEKGDLYRCVDSESLAASVAAIARCRTAHRDAADASSSCEDS